MVSSLEGGEKKEREEGKGGKKEIESFISMVRFPLSGM